MISVVRDIFRGTAAARKLCSFPLNNNTALTF